MKSLSQSCLTLCNPIDCSLPGSSVHGIFQVIVLKWIAISFSRGSSQPSARTRVSRIVDRSFTIWATREKHFPKKNLHRKKCHGHCFVVYCWCDPLQLSWWNHYIWEVCSANQWDAQKTAKPVASPGQQKEPNSFPWQCLTAHLTTNASNVEGIGLQSLICHVNLNSHQPPLLQLTWQLSAGKALPQPAGCRKCFPRVHRIMKHGFLCHRNKQTFLFGKNVIVMIPVLINEDVF